MVSVGNKKATFVSKSINAACHMGWCAAPRRALGYVIRPVGAFSPSAEVNNVPCVKHRLQMLTFVAFCSVSNRIAQIYKEARFGCRRVELVAALQAGLQAAALSTIVVFSQEQNTRLVKENMSV